MRIPRISATGRQNNIAHSLFFKTKKGWLSKAILFNFYGFVFHNMPKHSCATGFLLLFYFNGARKSQPSFQREQPSEVFPRITVPLPHNGQTSPSFTFPEAAFGFATFLSRVFPDAEAFEDFPFAGAAVHVTRLVFRSAITDATT